MSSLTKSHTRAPAKLTDNNFYEAIATRAYEKWERQGRSQGTDLKDWLEAEAEIMRSYTSVTIESQRRVVAEHAVTRILAESFEILQAAPRIVQAICVNLGWDVGVIWEVDRQADVLRCVDVWHDSAIDMSAFEQLTRQSVLSSGTELPGRIWAIQHPSSIEEISHSTNCNRATVAAREGLYTTWGFPIRNGIEFLGVMEFFSRRVHEPDNEIQEMMVSIGSQMSQFIERRRAEQMVRDRNKEFALARKVQQGLAPKIMPTVAGFEFGGASQFCQETGGDYYDVFPFHESSIGIAIGDASGHGIGAALVMEETRASIRALSLTQVDPGMILTLTNRCLKDDLPDDQFVTLFLARLDPVARSLVYSNAGHCPAYVLDQLGDVRLTLESTDIPLGLDSGRCFPSAPAITLAPGELLFLFTDGLVEATSPEENRFGTQHVLDVLRDHRQQSPSEIIRLLFRKLHEYCESVEPLDDITAVIMKVN